jgi:hypothetical protein
MDAFMQNIKTPQQDDSGSLAQARGGQEQT